MSVIKIPQPAMVLNSHDVPWPWYKMTNTRLVAKDVAPRDLLDNVTAVFKGFKATFPGQRKTLIINCHGGQDPPSLLLGTGIKKPDLVHFDKIAPYVDDIMVIACNAAANDGKSNGVDFMSTMAKKANASVTAGTEVQEVDLDVRKTSQWMPLGFVDDWEGPVMYFDNKGALVDAKLNGKSIF
jgi:hypothetical protein